MFTNYLKIAWRNLIRNKVYSALNIIGLSAGMTVALIIGLWAYNEYSYDRFLPGYRQLYQVEMNLTFQKEGMRTQTSVAVPLADVLRRDYPEVRYVAESDWVGPHALQVGTKKLYINGESTGSDFLKMFQFPLVEGDQDAVLKDPYSIVLTASTAKALFGTADPMNKTVKIDNKYDLKVSGVLKDIPRNSSLQFDYLIPFSFRERTEDWIGSARTSWTNNSFQIFVELKPDADYARLAPKIKDIAYSKSPEMRSIKPEIFLHPLGSWHLYSTFENGKVTGGFIDYVRMFIIIGILVLLIACINFINLSTARSEKRAREVGVRKAIGSQRKDLILQFLTETVLITFIAFALSILAVQLALYPFNALTSGSVHIPYGNPFFWLIMVIFVVITSLLAGTRPAFYLSSFKPVKVLKGTILMGKSGVLSRKVLVVSQFTCSVALIISTMIIYQQIRYAKERPTGYNADRLLMTDMSQDLSQHYDALKNDLMHSGLVENVAKASSKVTNIYSHASIKDWPGKNAGEEMVNVGAIYISDNYFNTLGIPMAAGRDFSKDPALDSTNVIINEAAARRMGLKDPVNQVIEWNDSPSRLRIIGVAKDALMESPFTPVAPAIFYHSIWGRTALYRLSRNVNTQEAIGKIETIFNKYNPVYPYSYLFVDEEYDQKFKLEILVGKLAGVFAVLAIFISCLGLFGLAAFIAEQRAREIGIRKVLGASVAQVWVLLSKDFVFLVLIGCILASAIAWYFLHNWLQKYEYRIDISPLVFLVSAVLAIIITLFTISFQAVKIALTNPVKNLRAE